MVSIEDINKLQEFIDLYLPDPSEDFESYSYYKWTANLILDSFLKNFNHLPEFITGREVQTAKDILYETESYFDSLASINSLRQEVFITILNAVHRIINFFIKGEADDFG